MELDGLSVYWDLIKKEQMFHELNLADLAVINSYLIIIRNSFLFYCIK